MELTDVAEEYLIYKILFSLSNKIQVIGDKEMKDITLKQHSLMIALETVNTPPTLKEMSTLIGCSYQNVKRMASQLVIKGYITIEQDKDDKRKLLLVPTKKLSLLTKEKKEKIEHLIKYLYKDIPREDMVVTLRTLQLMDKNISGIIKY